MYIKLGEGYITRGIKELSENGYDWLVNDLLRVLVEYHKNANFIVSEFIVQPDKTGVLKIYEEDAYGDKRLLHYKIYNNINVDKNLKFYWEGCVLFLEEEY